MAQIGLMIEGQNGLNWDNWQVILQTAEDSGYQCIFRSDHFTNASGDDLDSLELWTSLTYAASHTRRIEFGPLVTPVTFRHPSLTVRYANAVHTLSGGRLILGMGAGWQEREHKKFGIPFYDFNTRYDMLKDALELTIRLFKSDTPVSFQGKHFSLDDAILLPRPRPAGGPPILIGGNGPTRTLPLVATYADEWNAVFIDRATYRERTEQLNQILEERGRKPHEVKRSLMTQVIYEETDADLQKRLRDRNIDELKARGLIVGTGTAVVDQIGAWVEAGVERFMLQWLALDDLAGIETMAKEVLPHFHST